jgi:hypothetical protein
MLDTRFPRLPGDIGHPDAFGVAVRQRRVSGAFPSEVVRSAAALQGSGLGQLFKRAACELADEGARAITTSCGFLVLLQSDLQEAVRIPVVTSSLLQLPGLLAQQPQVGVLTISAEHLGEEYLLAAGVPAARLGDVPVQGVDPGGAFASSILGNLDHLDARRAEAEVVAAALALQRRSPGLRTVVLECTNLPPYEQALRDATGWQLRSLRDAAVLRDWATSSTVARSPVAARTTAAAPSRT